MPAVYHGGKKKVKEIDHSKLQSRDSGYFGEGFYVATHPTTARTYGSKLSEYKVAPDAKVLISSLKPEDSPKLVSEVKRDYYDRFIERAKARGKEDALLGEIEHITDSPISWAKEVYAYGKRNGYDVIHHSGGEVVVVNPKVLQFKKNIF